MPIPSIDGGRPPPNLDTDFAPLSSQQQNPTTNARPWKSFVDVVSDSQVSKPALPIKPTSLHRGEPAVMFTSDEIKTIAVSFKLSLVGKILAGKRPFMPDIRKFFLSLGLKDDPHVSLLDNRHIHIKLQFEKDYTRIWLKQIWYIGRASMRIFKWSTNFRCSEESLVVPV